MRLFHLTVSGFALALLACARAGAGGPLPTTGGDARRLDSLADDYFAAWARTYPITGMFDGIPDAPLDRLDPNALADVRQWRTREDRWLTELKGIRPEALRGRPEEATYGVLREVLEAAQGCGCATRSCCRSTSRTGGRSVCPSWRSCSRSGRPGTVPPRWPDGVRSPAI